MEGLDEILSGGLPHGGLFLVQGDPGAGKTTLALQFVLEGLRRREKVFYITLSENERGVASRRAISRMVARRHLSGEFIRY